MIRQTLWVVLCAPGSSKKKSRSCVRCLKKNQNAPRPSEHPPVRRKKCCLKKNVVVFTLKTFLTSIQYLLFLTLQGKDTNFRGHKLTQNKVQKNKKYPEKVPNTCEKNIVHADRFLKIVSSEKEEEGGRKTPKRKESPSLQTRKLSHNKIYYPYVVVVVSHIQRIGCQPEKNYFTWWPITLVVC